MLSCTQFYALLSERTGNECKMGKFLSLCPRVSSLKTRNEFTQNVARQCGPITVTKFLHFHIVT
jgi:hypothetical protein